MAHPRLTKLFLLVASMPQSSTSKNQSLCSVSCWLRSSQLADPSHHSSTHQFLITVTMYGPPLKLSPHRCWPMQSRLHSRPIAMPQPMLQVMLPLKSWLAQPTHRLLVATKKSKKQCAASPRSWFVSASLKTVFVSTDVDRATFVQCQPKLASCAPHTVLVCSSVAKRK